MDAGWQEVMTFAVIGAVGLLPWTGCWHLAFVVERMPDLGDVMSAVAL